MDGVPFTPIGKAEGKGAGGAGEGRGPGCLWQADAQSTADPVKASGASCLDVNEL